MGHHEQRAGRVALHEELVERGWKTFGFRADQSDSMTDYYHPADWTGAAVSPCGRFTISVGATEEFRRRFSGIRQIHRELVPGPACQVCDGSGVDPDAGEWTRETARQRPREFNAWRAGPRARAVFADVISPHWFRSDGTVKCEACHGKGHTMKAVETPGEQWPHFPAVPDPGSWCLAHGIDRIEQGSRLSLLDPNGRGDPKRSLANLMWKINAAMVRARATAEGKSYEQKRAETAANWPTGDVLVPLVNRDGSPCRVEVSDDPARPGVVRVKFVEGRGSDELRGQLKRANFRFYFKTLDWAGAASALPATFVAVREKQVNP